MSVFSVGVRRTIATLLVVALSCTAHAPNARAQGISPPNCGKVTAADPKGLAGQSFTTPTAMAVEVAGTLTVDAPFDGKVVKIGTTDGSVLAHHTSPLAAIEILVKSPSGATLGGSCATGGVNSYEWKTAGLASGSYTVIVQSGPTQVVTRRVTLVSGSDPVPLPTPEFCTVAPAVLTVKTWPNYKNATATAPNFTFTSPAALASITFYSTPIRAIALDTRGCASEAKK